MSRAPLVVLAAVAACRAPAAQAPASDPTLTARLDRIEAQLAQLEARAAGPATKRGDAPPADAPPADAPTPEAPPPADAPPADRLARVEVRLDKVVGFLKQAVPPTLDSDRTYAVPIDRDDPTLGPDGAGVTIVLAYEYLCPYCHLFEATLEQLRARFPRDVRVVHKYMVIHGAAAEPSGRAACAAGRQRKFAALHPALWAAIWSGGQPDRAQAEEAAVEGMAKAAGVNLARYRVDAAAGGPCAAWIARTAKTLQNFGAGGTPTLWLNGRPFDERDFDAMVAAVDAELARVRASGTAAASYYHDVVIAKGEPAAVMTSPFD